MSKYTRGLSKKTGLPPGSLLHIGNNYNEAVTLQVLDYDAEDFREHDVRAVEELVAYRVSPTITWISVYGLNDVSMIERIGHIFGIHPLVLEDILDTNHRPKLEDYGDYLYIVLKSLNVAQNKGAAGSDLAIEQVSLILGSNYIISFQENRQDLFNVIRERIKAGKGRIRREGADYLAYSLIDTIVDHYYVVLESLGEIIEDLEEALVLEPGRDALQEVHILKQKMLFFRKAMWPLREVVGALARGESPLIHEATLLYVRDVYDHTIQAIDTLETYRDIVSGMLDIYLSSISNRMNQIMKVLTIISTIFMPLTFITGVYGMNFAYMPGLDREWGYLAVFAVMLAVGLGMVGFFRTRKWL